MFSKSILAQFRKGGPERSSALSVRFSIFLQQSGIRTGHVRRHIPMASPPWDRVPPIIDTSLSAVPKGQLSIEEAQWQALEKVHFYRNYVTTYTDGSKSAGGVGCAFVSGSTTSKTSLLLHRGLVTDWQFWLTLYSSQRSNVNTDSTSEYIRPWPGPCTD